VNGTDDAAIGHPLHIAGAEAGHRLDLEVGERGPTGVALPHIVSHDKPDWTASNVTRS
jgi:hypothetical protein